MATDNLLPGMGSRLTHVVTTTADSVVHNSDPFDASKIAQVAVQVTTWASGNLTIQPQQSVDGVSWANLGSSTVVVAGDILRIGVTDGPLCLLRWQLASTNTAANATLTTVGYPVQWSN